MDLQDINKWKKKKQQVDNAQVIVSFEVKEVTTDAGNVREYPLVIFKPKQGGASSKEILLTPQVVYNFPKLQGQFAKYFQGKYDGSMEDAKEDVKNILIHYGFYSLSILQNSSRNIVKTLLEEIAEEKVIEVIKYLESKNCFLNQNERKKKLEEAKVDERDLEIKALKEAVAKLMAEKEQEETIKAEQGEE